MPPRPRPPQKKRFSTPKKRFPTKPRPPRESQKASEEHSGERLQKVLAAAGLGSRRQCEELIQTGRVEVDRQVVTELGTRVDPVNQEIRVDGTALPRAQRVYFALNKPAGVLCTNNDPAGRPRAIDLVPPDAGRLFTVGRLDMSSEGLVLLTNDGELANQLTHPRYGVEKTYRVLVAGHITPETIAKLRRGVHLAEGVASIVHARAKKTYKDSTWMEMVLDEGRNREIRRLLARVGHKVLRLIRVAVGPVHLAELPPGAYRRLTREEVDALRHAAQQPAAQKRAAQKPAAKRPMAKNSKPRQARPK